MDEYVSPVTQKGQVTIPGAFRKALNILPKDLVAFTLVDGEVRLRPTRSALLEGYGSVKLLRRPEDFSKLRKEMEEEIAEEVMKET